MTLGERISNLRKSKTLSQEDLASILNISRQAVYKWESDQSTPELDKLIALSNIFNVSLDELVKGDKPQTEEKNGDNSGQVKAKDKHTIIGAIFLGLGVLIALIINLVCSLPFIAIGLICLFAKKYIGLKCAWAAYTWFAIYMVMAMGINAFMVFRTFQWTYEMNYVRLAFVWIMFILMVAMIAVTVRTIIKNQKRSDKDVIIIIASVILLLIVWFFPLGKIASSIPSKNIDSSFAFWLNITSALLSLARTWLIILIFGKLIPIIKSKLHKNK